MLLWHATLTRIILYAVPSLPRCLTVVIHAAAWPVPATLNNCNDIRGLPCLQCVSLILAVQQIDSVELSVKSFDAMCVPHSSRPTDRLSRVIR
jgi:hypothetical protein